MKHLSKTLTFAAFFAAAATALSAQSEAEQIAAVKAATAKYSDVNAALADGFIPDPAGKCVTSAEEGLPPEWGGMGIHYLNPAILKLSPPGERVDGASTHTDFMQPAILLYEPQADGSLQLVGVENLVFQAAWAAAGNTELPSFAGRTWDTMADDAGTDADEAHKFAPHYDQHVWFRDSPAGQLLPFNPNVRCE
jgi:hypothetical protein